MNRRICLIIHSLGPGGMERVMSQLAAYFAEQNNVDVHLILYGKTRERFYEIPERIIVHKPEFRFSDSRRIWHTIKTLLFLRRTVRGISPDSILSFGEIWNNLVLLALLGLGFPVYITDRNSPERKQSRIHDFLRRRLYPKAAGLIVQTDKAREIAESRKLNANIQVIGNPIRRIDADDRYPKENIVLTVGRLIRTKHIDELIKLFVRIGESDWKLVIVGGDAQKQNLMAELKQLVEVLGARDKVALVGTCSDVESYYKRSKIFAFTSSSEGFPNVVGEAMAAGLPVVSFDCVAGPSEMISDSRNGFLVPVHDYVTFERRLRLLMNDPVLRKELGGNAREDIAAFSCDSIGAKFNSFITGHL